MKPKVPLLARSYRVALRKHLEKNAASDLARARELGKRAKRMGLRTLDLAKIHEEALLTVLLPHHTTRDNKSKIRRCVAFFAEAATPVEETPRGTREANRHLKQLLEALTQRTMELANSNLQLRKEAVRRRQMEDSLRVSEQTSSQLLEKSRQMQDELRLLSRRLLTAQEEERCRISRDLHDIVAQTLAGINLRLAALKSQTKANTRDLHQKIAATQRMVEESVTIVHRFARDLRPAVLDDMGLIPALKTFLRYFMEESSIRVSLITSTKLEKLPGDILTTLYRVVQEALTNVRKHSKASRVTVRIYEKESVAGLRIHDNGKGFEADQLKDANGSSHLGLLGIRERVEMVGGSFTVKSSPGKGTTLQVSIPLRPVKPSRTDVRHIIPGADGTQPQAPMKRAPAKLQMPIPKTIK